MLRTQLRGIRASRVGHCEASWPGIEDYCYQKHGVSHKQVKEAVVSLLHP